ncbi:DUF4340 domain-containing protein [Desulfobacterales bacterium HSG16]|nr:DUF4340 domain-containing protein [Desulfobacterales bacterium HSG16]
MKAKTFITLAVICGVLAGIAWFSMNQKQSGTAKSEMGKSLFTTFPINDIASINIKSADDEVVLKKGEKIWAVESRFDYPADFKMITDLSKKIRDLKVGRQFPASDATKKRLALFAPDNSDAKADNKGSMLTLKDAEDKMIASLILGKERESGGGHYVMSASKSDIYLVDKDFKYLDKKSTDWLVKEVMDVKADDVKQVICFAPETKEPLYTIQRPEKGKDPEIDKDVPEGSKLIANKISSLFSALASLRMEDVENPADADTKTGMDKAFLFEYQMFDGTVYKIKASSAANGKDALYYLKADVSYEKPEEKKPVEEAAKTATDKTDMNAPVAENTAPSEKSDAPKIDSVKIDSVKLKKQADKLNKKIGSWTYVISKWKYENLVTDPATFFEEIKKDEKASTPTDTKGLVDLTK